MEELNKFFDHYLHIMRWDKFVLEIVEFFVWMNVLT
jgi:hypothetical protein